MERVENIFSFPSSTEGLSEVRTQGELRDLLTSRVIMEEVRESSTRYRYAIKKVTYLYARCCWKGCRAILKYRWINGTFFLHNAILQHRHPAASSCSRSLKFRAVEDYLRGMHNGVALANLKAAVCGTFAIGEKQFYYMLSRLQGKRKTFGVAVAELEQKGYEVYISNEERQQDCPPDILVVVSPKMRQMFRIYDGRVSFGLTFSLIKDRNKEGSACKIGGFLGVSATNKIVPFGVVIMKSTVKEAFRDAFRMFFAAVGGQPEVIMTDEDRSIHAALVLIQREGEYAGTRLYDGYHIIHNIYKKLSKKEHIHFFSNLLDAKNFAEWQKWLGMAQEELERADAEILKVFLERKELFYF